MSGQTDQAVSFLHFHSFRNVTTITFAEDLSVCLAGLFVPFGFSLFVLFDIFWFNAL